MGQHHHFAHHLANMRNTFLLVLLGFVGLAISLSQEDEQTKELEDELDEDNFETWGELEELDELTEESDRSLEISRTERDADPEKKKGMKRKNGKGRGKNNKTNRGNKKGRGNRKAKSSKSGSKTKSGKGKNKIGNKRRQGNKNPKSSKRHNKSGKNQKNKSSKPKKKGRKAKKPSTKQNTKAKTHKISACSRAVNSTCLDTAVKLLKIVNSRVTNFLIQQKRMSKYNSTGGKKSGKKGLFGPIASKVIDVGGGNASDLSCSGNKTNVGATKLKSIISSLQTCEENI